MIRDNMGLSKGQAGTCPFFIVCVTMIKGRKPAITEQQSCEEIGTANEK